ncbi:MAG: hypothetical protein PHQ23_05585, partial [Candidatus Wallbacteria bacterium]|nr:hypothetical protein [Candidatus Wallbacteria bacterium]
MKWAGFPESMNFKSFLAVLLFFLVLGSLFGGGGFLLYAKLRANSYAEIEERYQRLLSTIVAQINHSSSEEHLLFLKKNFEELTRTDRELMNIVFLTNNGDTVMSVGTGLNEISNQKIFLKNILKNGEPRGVCQIVISLDEHIGRNRKLLTVIALNLSCLFLAATVLMLYCFHVYFQGPENSLCEALCSDDTLEKNRLARLKLPYIWHRLRNVLTGLFRNSNIAVAERELLHPVTDLPSYYYTCEILNRGLHERVTADYLIVTMLGFNILSETYGFSEAYDFLEKLCDELNTKLKTSQADVFFVHLTDTTLIVRCHPDNTKELSEKLLVIFRNIVRDYSDTRLSLKKEWSRMIIFAFSSHEIEESDLSRLEDLYFKSLFKISKRVRSNVA